MCGIAGIWSPADFGNGEEQALYAMRDSVSHRGPDDCGDWFDSESGIGLAHRRLSILELSAAGHQPMVSASGRHVMTYNGEIYNFQDLRQQLDECGKAPVWRGHSDTEVLLAAIDAWGLADTLPKCKGMFALAVWDRETRLLSLARDPMGEKPLYIARFGGRLAFASELKAIMAHPDWDGPVDRTALGLCLRHGYIPAPYTIFENAWKPYPGEIVTIAPKALEPSQWKRHRYWDTLGEAAAARRDRFEGSVDDATDRLDSLIRQSVVRQAVSDVPLGAFLSGGIDSSMIVAAMQAEQTRPVETFALGFHEKEANEAEFAKAVAGHLGTNHHEIYLKGEDAVSLVQDMPAVYDEPFTDQSQLPTYLLCQFARGSVTVAQTGDGGDELFGGYRRYHSFMRKWQDGKTRGVSKRLSGAYSSFLLNQVIGPAQRYNIPLPKKWGNPAYGFRLMERARKFATDEAIVAYDRSFTLLDPAHMLINGGREAMNPSLTTIAGQSQWTALEKISCLDAVHYLPDNILVKVDRAAMAHSLETRVPLLDPEIVRFAFSLPEHIKLADGHGKGILRRVLGRYVPQDLWDRPKQGFGIPTAAWLRGPFKEIASDMFDPVRLRRMGFFDEALVTSFWNQFLGGQNHRAHFVWALFITQLYLERLTGGSR